MRNPAQQKFVDGITDALLEHGVRIEAASDEGLMETAVALDDLIKELKRRRDALVLAAQPCPDPDCPIHGHAARQNNPNLN